MHLALYRKYRPATFEDVVGQVGVTETLKAQLASGRYGHAYLFTGTRGTGKTTCARILAKAVNCLSPVDGNPCGVCEACRMIDAESCVDVQEIDAASNNGVDQIRTLRDEAVYTPAQVKKRVYIVDEVHMLSVQAFNALLKLMEEPPEHLIFILATTELHKIPATILSRCQRFSFRRLTAEDIAKQLGFVAYEEGIELQTDAAELLANLADGAMRDGLSLLDQCASATTGAVTAQTVCSVLGLAGQQNTAKMLHAIADGNAAGALELFHELYDLGKDVSAMAGELGTLARDLLVLRTAPQSGPSMLSGVSASADREALLKKLSPAQLLRILTVIQKTAAGFALSQNKRLDMEVCLMELCSPAVSRDVDAISARLGRLEEQLAAGAIALQAPPAAAAPAQTREPATEPEAQPLPEPEAEQTGELPEDFWPEFLARVKPELQIQHGSFFSPAGPIRPRLCGGVLYLEAESAFVFRIMKDDEALLQMLARKASAQLGKPVRVQFSEKGSSISEKDPMEELLHNENITIINQ